ncbi:uncharacterized protein [Lepeophtheirus salmonis]|uniref:uncharacterized protein isoform X1 n=1 Tax=Lepeophtheirus salmonis TaxID=72036 RepID=UPI001AE27D5A|nr:uncharacterized protein LOC121113692 isoform X1 [Lepeophtheirus salmonis]
MKTSEVLLWLFASIFYGDIYCNPIKGITNCLNNEDCLGSNRRCHRNSSLLTGICTCKDGFFPAKNDKIACLNIKIRECVDSSDCPPNLICHSGPQYLSFRESKYQKDKVCTFVFNSDSTSVMGIGGDLRSSHIYDHFFVGRRNRIHPPFHPEYIKFVEDAMLVLFLICVLVTLLIVHRASCFRYFRNARRNGVLRYIIPHGDDIPPPYSQYGPPVTSVVPVNSTENEGESNTNGQEVNSVSENTITHTERILNRNFKASRPETPPPSYAEALLISQARSASLRESQVSTHQESNANGSGLPLYIALPPCETTSSSSNIEITHTTT